MAWVTLAQLKNDLGIEIKDTRDDLTLTGVLNSAVSYVERLRSGDFNFTDDVLSELPVPTEDLKLGTIRLAGRWFNRRRSPDGLVNMQEMGVGRVPSFDPDIDRLLGIGKYRRSIIA